MADNLETLTQTDLPPGPFRDVQQQIKDMSDNG